jgi:hypothetical protein
MSSLQETEGPIIVWVNYGYEGWQPKSYHTLKEALLGERYSTEFVVTRLVTYEVTEVKD